MKKLILIILLLISVSAKAQFFPSPINLSQILNTPHIWTGTQTFDTILPRITATYDLGSLALTWKNIYLAPTGIIYLSANRYLHATGSPSNIFLGNQTGNLTTTGTFNTGVGALALFSISSGIKNVALGSYSMGENTTGSSNLTLGAYSGYYGTYSNRFFLDNQLRTNSSTQETQSLMTGTFNANPYAQKLTFNATIKTQALYSDIVTVVDSVVHCSYSNNFTKVLSADQRFVLDSIQSGQTIIMTVMNDSIWTTTYVTPVTIMGTSCTIKWGDGVTPTQSTGTFAIRKTDVITFIRQGTVIYGSALKNF